MDNKIKFRPIISIIIILIFLALDQLSKIWAANDLSNTPLGVSIIDGVVSLYYIENTGISFSLLNSHTILIIIVTLIILALLCFVLIRTPKTHYYLLFSVTLSVIIAGALGNLIDRILRGYVIDFISLDIINFPVFNVADICVCLGLFILIIMIFVKYKDKDFEFIFKKGSKIE